mgnify:FL=1
MEKYTKILDAKPENHTINILADLLSGKDGELCAIMQYFYQIAMTSDKELKRLLEEIDRDEMMHARLLADAIVQFGGIPYLCNQYNKFFTTEYLDYAMNEREFLITDIRDEEKAIKSYEKAIEMVDNESLKTLFGEIMEDEKMHLKKLREQLERFDK